MKKKIVLIIIVLFSFIFIVDSSNNNVSAVSRWCPYCGKYTSFSIDASTTATCTQSGTLVYICDECGIVSDPISSGPLGHHYVRTSHKDATCTEDGYDKYRCDRQWDSPVSFAGGYKCNETKTTVIPALGHDYVITIITDAGCETEGLAEYKCNRCSDSYEEILPPTGHSYPELQIIKEPSCTEDGLKEAECEECGQNISEIIPALGHKYGEWIIDKEASQFSKGHKYKQCQLCEEIVEENIDKLPFTAVTIITAVVTALAVIGGGALFTLKKNANRKLQLTLKEPESKTLLTYIKDEDITGFMKTKTYLEVKLQEYDQLDNLYETVKEEEPDIAVIQVDELLQFEKVFSLAEKFDDDVSTEIGLIINIDIVEQCKEKLKFYKKEKKLLSWVKSDSHNEIKILNLIAPLYKFDITDDDDLEKIGKLADFLQIPYVSKVIDVYTTGKGLKEDLETEDKGFTDYSTIVGDLAAILGLEKVEKVTDFIDSVDTVKSSIKKDAGAYEVKETYSSASDIVDAIKDVINSNE